MIKITTAEDLHFMNAYKKDFGTDPEIKNEKKTEESYCINPLTGEKVSFILPNFLYLDIEHFQNDIGKIIEKKFKAEIDKLFLDGDGKGAI
jgi:hypothetical protein